MTHCDQLQGYDPFLFSMELEFQRHLDNAHSISTELRGTFKNHGIRLPHNSSLSTQSEGNRWAIADRGNKKEYVITKKENKLSVYENLHVVNQIVERDLCVRCGACEPACPVDIIRFNDQAYPYIKDEELCIATCTRCLKVCPGETVDFAEWDKEMFGVTPHPESVAGIARRAFVSFATDDKLRQEATSGGLVTQLLQYMMDKQLIDGALVLGSSNDSNGWRPEPMIARTTAEIRNAKKSKYTVIPFLRPIAEMERIEGKYAVVALPCYIHALKKYQRVSKKLQERIKLIIGLYCNVAFEPYLLDDLCEFQKVKKEDVVNLDFRHGKWPGGVYAEFKDGSQKKVLKLEEMKDEFNLLKLFYTAPRCNMCIDFSAEYADLSVGDPWLRGPDGKYLFEDGRTSILVRTEIGDQILRMANDEGYINLKEIPLKTWMVNFERNARYKRDFVPQNIALRKLFGLPVPRYNRHVVTSGIAGFPSLIKNAVLMMATFKWFRRCGIFLAQTQPAIMYFARNRKRKAERFAAVYATLEKFVERFLTYRAR